MYILLNGPAIMGNWDKTWADSLNLLSIIEKTNPDLYRTDVTFLLVVNRKTYNKTC